MAKKDEPLPGWMIVLGVAAALAAAFFGARKKPSPPKRASAAPEAPAYRGIEAPPPPPAEPEPEPAPGPIEWRSFAPPKVAVPALLPDMPDKRPATEAQAAAVLRLGLAVENLTFGQANAVLSARDYAETLIARTPRIEPASARMRLIQWLVEDEARIVYVMDWSWHTRNHDTRRVPRDEFRAAAEAHLATL